MLAIVTLVMSGVEYLYIKNNAYRLKYIFPEEDPNARYWGLNALGSYFILMNSVIPLSMILTLEGMKMYYAVFFEDYVEMIEIDQDDY